MNVLLIFVAIVAHQLPLCKAFPDQSRWSFNVRSVGCRSAVANATIDLGLVVRASPCFEEYQGFEVSLSQYLQWYYHCPRAMHFDFEYTNVTYLKTEWKTFQCGDVIPLDSFGSNFVTSPVGSTCQLDDRACHTSYGDSNQPYKVASLPKQNVKNGHIITLPSDDVYLMVLKTRSQSQVNLTVDISFQSPSGAYLSAIDRPLLTFYAFMSILYLAYAVLWFIISMIQWKELLRIQFCIAVVILLGMLEKAIFLGVYESLDLQGFPNHTVFYIAELFSCLKRTFARVLVVIVSCGYEIVKPTLGRRLNKIIAVGVLYFILGSLEATMRIYKPKSDPSNQTLFAGIPLALLDTSICWWIFSNLVNTMKILRIRRNVVKLRLFNMFTNVLVFSLLASVGFTIWQIRTNKFSGCISNWKDLWFVEAYWHILFSIILLVIMILWRPTKNNQRYAFTPLLDVSDDEDAEVLYEDSYRTMETGDVKNRNVDSASGRRTDQDDGFSKETIDNLKWIEENISASLIDSANSNAFADDDEDLLNTRFEISKMQ